MTNEPPKETGKADFLVEGFSIEWDGDGLLVRAIDYHATELLLRWDYLLSLAEASQKNPVRKNRGQGAGDVCGKLL